MTLRFTIVTPTYNRRTMLQEAVESVRAQGWPSVQHIIVDGGSTDGTKEWIETQEDLTWIAGPDRGVYDALNKGIDAADGDIIGFLNSDDMYVSGTFTAAAGTFLADPTADSVGGASLLVDGSSQLARFDDLADISPDPQTILLGRCLPNPRFFRRAALTKVGPFSLDYPLVSDRDFLIRFIESGCRTAVARDCFYIYRQHQDSLTFDAALKNSRRIRAELIELGSRWSRMGKGHETRMAAHVLVGRQRFMLAFDALRRLDIREVLEQLAMERGRISFKPVRAIARAIWVHPFLPPYQRI